ncbi:alpha/beta fold hydrolase [Streptomyces sp. NPDC056638]|uniref:alpha/beta fold hydrolase n=1 Tax=Streptomyces sp. NPDC056638 TaxID=3345887 RepID=UPI00367CA310
MVPPRTGPLTEGTHTLEADGLALLYHVHGTGPACVAHPGGPGIAWEYLRAPELERSMTMVYLEPAGTGGSDRLASHPHGYTRDLYSRHLAALIDHLAVGPLHLLGHSHGGFVAQYHAMHRPDQLAGVVLYESAPGNGPEFGEEMIRRAGEFAALQAARPDVQSVMDAFAAIPAISDDDAMVAAAKGVLPAYVADYWADTPRWSRLQEALRATYISGLDGNGAPDLFDDRKALRALKVPALVVVGRHDVVCGVRWGQELQDLLPASQLLLLEHSGHFGHLEEPEKFAHEIASFVGA